MKLKIISVLFAAFFLLSGCGKEGLKKENKTQLLSQGERYRITFTVGEVQTTGEIFFSEGGTLHFLHTDSLSPLFGMEEVFTSDKHLTLFHEMEYESELSMSGTALLSPLIHTLRSEEPESIKKEKETSQLIFDEENVSVSVLLDENGKMLEVKGEVFDTPVRITFFENA